MPSLLARLTAIALPEICGICQGACTGGFCQPCRTLLSRVPSPCLHCGLPAVEKSGHCCTFIPAVDAVTAPFIFQPPLKDCIHAFKYRRRRSLGRALALLLLEATGDRVPVADALIPVPLHPSRLRQRTYNQADEIAATLAAAIGIALLPNAVRRAVATSPQALLHTDKRMRNLHDAFQVDGHIHGLDVTIVDDVVTTGATVGTLAAALCAAGAARVSVWAVARTLPAFGSSD